MKNKAAQKLGKLGGQATAKKLGSKHFSEAGKKGMANRWAKPNPPTEPIHVNKNLQVDGSSSKEKLTSEPTVEKWEFKCSRCKKVEKVPGFVAEHLRGKNPPWCNKCEDEYRYWLNNPNQALSVQEAKAEGEIEKIASNIALMKILVKDGKKGDMERLIKEFEEKLEKLLASLKQEEEHD